MTLLERGTDATEPYIDVGMNRKFEKILANTRLDDRYVRVDGREKLVWTLPTFVALNSRFDK